MLLEISTDKVDTEVPSPVSGTIREIEDKLVDAYPKRAERVFKTFGFIALGTGLTLIFLIVYSMLFGYR